MGRPLASPPKASPGASDRPNPLERIDPVGDSPTTLVHPEWCEGRPHGAPACPTATIKTITLDDGTLTVTLAQQDDVDKTPVVTFTVHAYGDNYTDLYVARLGIFDAAFMACVLASADAVEGWCAYERALTGSHGGEIANALAVAVLESGVDIPAIRPRRRGRKPQVTTLRGRIAQWWEARR